VVTFAIIKSKFLIVDPLLCEEQCADVLIRVIVYYGNDENENENVLNEKKNLYS